MAPENGTQHEVDIALWIYSHDDSDAAASIANAETVVLLPSDQVNAKRRPEIVQLLQSSGYAPDYTCDLHDVGPAAVLLRRSGQASVDVAVSERALARLNTQVLSLQRALRTRMAELETADRHIATLEEKLLKLKEYRRSIKELKAEKQALKRSPERRVGQVLLAPYRLPQRLVRGVRKHWPNKSGSGPTEYQRWFDRHRVHSGDISRLRDEARAFTYTPTITVITPVYNTPADWLRAAVESVIAQVYENWELILVDDASTNADVIALLREFTRRDSRIVVTSRSERGGISMATNAGLEIAKGEFVAFFDHDDVLEPDALFHHVRLLQSHRDADLIYSDEDKLTDLGLDVPTFKPDWSPDFFLACNYICHLTLLRRTLLEEVGPLRPEFDGAQDYELLFRVIERTQRIHHIPRVLYHWRLSDASTADNIRRKPNSLETGRLAVEAHLKRSGVAGHVAVDWRTHAYWVKRDIADPQKISIVIPVRDRVDLLRRCIGSLTSHTAYEPFEIIVVDNDSASAEMREYLASVEHRVLRFEGPFNFSAMNNLAVEQSDSPWLLFLNNDTEVIESGWLSAMAEHVQRPEVGAVGARLLFGDDTVQHAGVVVGVGGVAEHAFRGFAAEAPGVRRQLQVTRNYSAVTGACLMTRRSVFEEMGGFDEEALPVTFSDIDLCLRMRRAGYLIVYTPYAKLYHHESSSRQLSVEPRETQTMRERWADVLENDPYYNPNLSRRQADFSLGE